MRMEGRPRQGSPLLPYAVREGRGRSGKPRRDAGGFPRWTTPPPVYNENHFTMKRFTERQVAVLRQTSMRDILAAEGHNTAHTRGNLYYSPFRVKEKAPSLHIDDENHRWFDHGNPDAGVGGKRGGDTVDFVRMLKGCGFVEALEYLCRYNPSVVPGCAVEAMEVPKVEDAIVGDGDISGRYVRTEILETRRRFTSHALTGFAAGRGIPRPVLERYCRELSYVRIYDNGGATVRRGPLTSIGFPNSEGGWTVRFPAAPREGRQTGKNTIAPGGATLLARDGTTMPTDGARATAPSVIVFEGFMDFMSWITAKRPEGTPGDTDIVVLNSVANIHKAMPFILAHRNVIAMTDNDAAGDAAARELENAARREGLRFMDNRAAFAGSKDYNEHWQKTLLGRKVA